VVVGGETGKQSEPQRLRDRNMTYPAVAGAAACISISRLDVIIWRDVEEWEGQTARFRFYEYLFFF
jgi:hypothetical protein